MQEKLSYFPAEFGDQMLFVGDRLEMLTNLPDGLTEEAKNQLKSMIMIALIAHYEEPGKLVSQETEKIERVMWEGYKRALRRLTYPAEAKQERKESKKSKKDNEKRINDAIIQGIDYIIKLHTDNIRSQPLAIEEINTIVHALNSGLSLQDKSYASLSILAALKVSLPTIYK